MLYFLFSQLELDFGSKWIVYTLFLWSSTFSVLHTVCLVCLSLNATILDTFGDESTLVYHGSTLRLNCDCSEIVGDCETLSISAPNGSILISDKMSNRIQVEVNILTIKDLGNYKCMGITSSGEVFQQKYTLSYKLCKYSKLQYVTLAEKLWQNVVIISGSVNDRKNCLIDHTDGSLCYLTSKNCSQINSSFCEEVHGLKSNSNGDSRYCIESTDVSSLLPKTLCQAYLNRLNTASEKVYALAMVNSNQYCSKPRDFVWGSKCKF